MINPQQWTSPGLLKAPKPARLTGMGLWGLVDDLGRMEARAELIAGAVYPGDPTVTVEMIETHLLMLDESGFLTIYQAQGRTWLQLADPLPVQRPSASECPDPPNLSETDISGGLLDMERERARERARAWVEAEDAEAESRWEQWGRERDGEMQKPERPLILDAPPIGCPEHPNGSFQACGPCGTARKQQEKFLARSRYERLVEEYEIWKEEER